ncbi:hypothetical protein L2E82_12668 [Cichorium intybus]|uniref:Uncharacterized protein n=1 Tax=Cichorium intybus TaxID=13427 RepID=A0ACB9GHC6_CICIN|nr:hypothetical protein L2E82_12668 [Cichorium intybus]
MESIRERWGDAFMESCGSGERERRMWIWGRFGSVKESGRSTLDNANGDGGLGSPCAPSVNGLRFLSVLALRCHWINLKPFTDGAQSEARPLSPLALSKVDRPPWIMLTVTVALLRHVPRQ